MAHRDISVSALRRAYLAGEILPSEVMENVVRRLSDADQDAVWISTVDPDRLIAAARELDGRIGEIEDLPLYGTLFSTKDNIDVAGLPTTAACPAFAYSPDRSATVVARAEAAGAICIGKTNLDQFATGLVGVRSPYGVPKNPFNPDYIPGGSSSGAAVSVATGTASFAFGTDTGGSGRVPASYNGLVGYKPAPGDWSRAGLVFACRSFDTPTVFAGSVQDVRAVDAVVRGADTEDAFSVAIELEPAVEARIAMPLPDVIETFGDDAVKGLYQCAFTAILARFPDLGSVDLDPFRVINDHMFFGPFLAERDVSVGAFIETNGTDCHEVVRGLIQSSRKFTAADAYRAFYEVAEARLATAPVWATYDVLITPTVGALVTLEMCRADPLGPNFRNGYYTNFANPMGLSSCSVPAGITPDGVPWGLTLYSLPERAETLMRAADLVAMCTAPKAPALAGT